MIRKIDSKEETRVESGAIQFGDDWPGYFLRGDNAFSIYMTIQNVLNYPEDRISRNNLSGFADDLLECNTNGEQIKKLREHYK